jgi:hypothetical protein
MNIYEEVQKYFIPVMYRWSMKSYLTFHKNADYPFSIFIIVDNMFFVKLTYHCIVLEGQRWSFVKSDSHYKVHSSEQITFITEKDIDLLIDCLISLHHLALFKKDDDD